VGAIGAGMEDTALLTTLVRETDVEVLMLPGQCTLLDQSVLDGLLPACQERGASVIAAAVFHSGVLAQNRPRSRSNVWLPHRAVGGPGSSQPHRRGVRRGSSDLAQAVRAFPLTLRGHRRCFRYALRCGGSAECQLLCGGRTRSTVE
jgi:aryl-alcohol dehydrogenase-like predicted oxidoreductase